MLCPTTAREQDLSARPHDLDALDSDDPGELAEPGLHGVAVGNVLGTEDLEAYGARADAKAGLVEDLGHAGREAVAEQQRAAEDLRTPQLARREQVTYGCPDRGVDGAP